MSYGTPTIRTSGRRAIPCTRSTVERTCSMRCSRSAARAAVIDDEIRVLTRDRGVADAVALESRGLDETRGVIARGVGEHRAAAPLADRLRLLAPREELVHLIAMGAGAALEGKLGADEPLLGCRSGHLAVADAVLALVPHPLLAMPVDGLDGEHVLPGLASESAGIHRQSAAKGPGYAGEELRGAQAPLDALARDARAGDAGLGVHAGVAEALEPIERPVSADDDARESPVAHQQIAAEPDPVDRHIRGQATQESREIRAVARIEEHFGRTADMPGGVTAEGLAPAHARIEAGSDGDRHGLPPAGTLKLAGSACAAALMLPAPIATMTSPSL